MKGPSGWVTLQERQSAGSWDERGRQGPDHRGFVSLGKNLNFLEVQREATRGFSIGDHVISCCGESGWGG